MNKLLAIAGSVAGVVSAGLLMMGMSSINSFAGFSGCTDRSAGPMTSRELQWHGADAVQVNIPGTVQFTVGPAWRAVASGPAEALRSLRFDHGRIEFDPAFRDCGSDVKIELQGPAVSHWQVRGSGTLLLTALAQDQLDITMSGSGSVSASGKVRDARAALNGSGDLRLDNLPLRNLDVAIHGSGSVHAHGTAEQAQIAVFGSGTADVGKLAVKSASVRIHGSGDVSVAPAESLDAQIHGSGDVHLLRTPPRVQQRIHGSGEIITTRG